MPSLERTALQCRRWHAAGMSERLVMLGEREMRARRSLKWSMPAPIIGMSIAEADVELAAPIRAALLEAVRCSRTGPLHETGALSQAFANFAAERWSWRFDVERTLIGPSVNATIVALLRQLTTVGDIVAYSSPVYPVFAELPSGIHATSVDVPLRRDGPEWALDVPALEKVFSRHNVRVYLLCHPQNPTGTVHKRSDLLALAEAAMRHGVTVLSDEIHAPLDLSGDFTPFLMCGPAAEAVGLVLTSPSKGWNLSGVNCAVAVWTNPAFDLIGRQIADGLRWESGILGFVAGQAAYAHGGDWIDAFRRLLRDHVRLIEQAAHESNGRLRVGTVKAGYLAWLDLRSLTGDPATVILREASVAVTAGHRFGASGVGYCRLNFACSTETLNVVLSRILSVVVKI